MIMNNEIETMLADVCGPRIDEPRDGMEANCHSWNEATWLIHQAEWCNIFGIAYGWHIARSADEGRYDLIMRITTDGHQACSPIASGNTVEEVAAMVAEATECLGKTGMLPTPTTEAN